MLKVDKVTKVFNGKYTGRAGEDTPCGYGVENFEGQSVGSGSVFGVGDGDFVAVAVDLEVARCDYSVVVEEIVAEVVDVECRGEVEFVQPCLLEDVHYS